MRLWRTELLWAVLVGAILLLAVWWFPGKGSVDTDTYSVGRSGKRVFYELIERFELKVSREHGELAPVEAFGDRLLILGPARHPSADEWETLADEVRYGTTLVFAAKASDPSVDAAPFGVRVKSFTEMSLFESDDESDELTPEDDVTLEDDSAVDDEDVDEFGGLFEERFAETELVSGQVSWSTNGKLAFDNEADWDILVSAKGKPQVARRTYGDGVVIFVASDSCFTNNAMLEDDIALLAYRIVEQAPSEYGHTRFDETLNSSGTPKVFGILFDPILRPLTLQICLLLAVFGWMGSHRFGPVKDATTVRRRNIEEHAEALGVLYYKGKEGVRPVQSLTDFLTFELMRIGGPTFHTDSAEAVARAAQMDVDEVHKLLTRAKAADKLPPNRTETTRILRGLSQVIVGIREKRSKSTGGKR